MALQGVVDQMGSCPAIGNRKLLKLVEHGGVQCCFQLAAYDAFPAEIQSHELAVVQDTDMSPLPDSIQQLILQFDHLFQTPSVFPPPRPTDHKITLVPGA